MEDSKIYIIKISSYRESSNLYDAIAKDYGKIRRNDTSRSY